MIEVTLTCEHGTRTLSIREDQYDRDLIVELLRDGIQPICRYCEADHVHGREWLRRVGIDPG